MGPVLHFRGVADGQWRIAAGLLAATGEPPPSLRPEGQPPVEPVRLADRLGRTLWRYDFGLPLGDRARLAGYAIGAQRWTVSLPEPDGGLHIAYAACNGSADEGARPHNPERNALWRDLAATHAAAPFHLLLQGGDQLYADGVWEEVAGLRAWLKLPRRHRPQAAFTPAMEQEAGDYYFRRYAWLWAQPEVAPMVAQVPSLMMWDDHDVFDGWGSHDTDIQASPVFQGIWRAAREHFALFQLGARPEDLPPGFGDLAGGHFGWCYRLGRVGIIAPDLRSGRSQRQVMDEAGRRWFDRALEGLAGCDQVLLMSSVPLVNADLSAVERVLLLIPGQQLYQDDLRDQWRSFAHREEWLEMLRRLTGFVERSGARVTVLSGEIHLGGLAAIESGAVRIDQLTSSGIVHEPPHGAMVAVFDWLARRSSPVAPDLTVHVLEMPGLGRRYLRARNWLELDVAEGRTIRGLWHAEGRAGTRVHWVGNDRD